MDEDNLQAFMLRDLELIRLPDAEARAVSFATVEEARTAYFYAEALHDFRHGADHDTQRLLEAVETWPSPLCERSTAHHSKCCRSSVAGQNAALIQHAPRGGGAHLLRLMAQNWQQGTKDRFPNLMLIDDGRVRFVEVKTAGDSLRRNQLTCLEQLSLVGFSVKIVNFAWAFYPDQPYVVVDVKTTGGKPGLHRLTEIGAVKMNGGEVVDEFQTLLNPQRSIRPSSPGSQTSPMRWWSAHRSSLTWPNGFAHSWAMPSSQHII